MSYPSAVLADSPAGYWRLDETAGTAAADASGNARTGTYTRAGHYTLARAGATANTGTSVAFDGGVSTGGYIAVPNAAVLQLSGDLSLEAWFRTTNAAVLTAILTKYTNSGSFPGYGLRTNASGKVGFYLGDTWQETALSYNDGAWHHAVGTLSGTTGTIYLDGVPVSTATRAASLVTTTQLTIATDPGLGLCWGGNLDEVAVYDSALSAARVQAHYAASATGSPLLMGL